MTITYVKERMYNDDAINVISDRTEQKRTVRAAMRTTCCAPVSSVRIPGPRDLTCFLQSS